MTEDRKKIVPVLLLLSLGLLIIMEYTTPQIERFGGWDNDGVYYGDMLRKFRAAGNLSEVPAPYCYRVFTPYLASLLPFAPLLSFQILGFLSNWISLLLMYGIARKSGVEYRFAIVGMLLYAGVFWTVKFTVFSPGYIDFQTQMLILLAVYLLLVRAHWLLPVLIALAVLQKESLLFLSLLAWFDYARSHGFVHRKSMTYLAAVVALPVASLLLVRLAVPAVTYTTWDLFWSIAKFGHPERWPRLVLALFSGLGLLPVLLIFDGRSAWRYLKNNPTWLVMIVLGLLLLFGGFDKSRLFLYMLPAVVVVSGHMIQRNFDHGGRRLWLWLAVTVVLHYYLGHHFTPMRSFDEYVNRMVPVHAVGSLVPHLVRVGAVCIVWLAVTVYTRSRSYRNIGGCFL